ncbi:hypothetical protein ACCQ10_00670 [Xanthomonas sp. NCPPB 1325]|uniref:hypothetical protein n=1 Tax=Xanthomonas sp. NCPPB 1325 TaxID=487529 RepID=UPI0035590CAC
MTKIPEGEASKGSPRPDRAQVAVAIAGFAFLGFLVFKYGVTYPFKTTVACSKIEGGESCLVRHDSKETQTIAQCIRIKRVCANGVMSDASACFEQAIGVKKYGKILFADSEFSDNDRCDKVVDHALILSTRQPKAEEP